MDNGNGAAPVLSVVDDIRQRLEAIREEDFIAPSKEREAGAHFVCEASDSVKRLYTLRALLNREAMDVARVGANIAMTLMFETPGSPEAASSIEKARSQRVALDQANTFGEIVDRIFWLEVRRQHADLQSNTVVCVYCDWSLCWEEADESDGATFEIVSMGHGSLAELLALAGRR
jgi:hypothetical protein